MANIHAGLMLVLIKIINKILSHLIVAITLIRARNGALYSLFIVLLLLCESHNVFKCISSSSFVTLLFLSVDLSKKQSPGGGGDRGRPKIGAGFKGDSKRGVERKEKLPLCSHLEAAASLISRTMEA